MTVETPERVELTLEVAGLGTRALAYLVDLLILFLFWITLAFVFSIFQTRGLSLLDFQALDSLLQVLIVLAAFAVQWAYWIVFETAWGGRSPGKRALKIRVVKIDGSPVGFMDTALRNLGRVVDFLPALYAVGLASMMIHPRSRRLGDLLAGTVLVRDRQIDLSRYDQPEPSSSATASVALSPAEYELVTGFLARAGQLDPDARARIALRLAEPLARRHAPGQSGESLKAEGAAEALLRRLVNGNG